MVIVGFDSPQGLDRLWVSGSMMEICIMENRLLDREIQLRQSNTDHDDGKIKIHLLTSDSKCALYLSRIMDPLNQRNLCFARDPLPLSFGTQF